MIVIKKRLIFWLLKAYIKKWGKALFLSFLLGLIIFFLLKSSFPYIIAAFTGVSKQTIGVLGAYTLDNLPSSILQDISQGLTKVNANGTIAPGVALSWDIKNNGKLYLFHLKKNLRFSDGTPLTCKDISLNFSGASKICVDNNTLAYTLTDVYSPFLVSVSRPIFKSGLVGIGNYRIKRAQVNGSFVESLTLTSTTVTPALKIYQFYPTQDALKVAFALGEINQALNVTSISFQNTTLTSFPRTTIDKSTNYDQLVALFYNTKDKDLSNKALRDALSYSFPNTFVYGRRAFSPIPPTSWAYDQSVERLQDVTHARLLLAAAYGKNPTSLPHLTITTLPRYQNVALAVEKSWRLLGITSKIEVVDSLPPVFQIYLGSFSVPQDPDQYTLWHSYQGNNITNYSSVRIDTLLEEGRKTLGTTDRLKLYQEFQKYLIDDQPATFLYFPYEYTVTKM